MPPVMTEDNAIIQSEESNEALLKEVSEHDEIISVHEFKEVLDEVVNDAVDKIVMKKAGIVGKLKTAKQNLIGHIGEATSRDPQQILVKAQISCPVFPCQCSEELFDELGRGNCNSKHNGKPWCFLTNSHA